MFSSNHNNQTMPFGIPKPKSLLTSFLFSRSTSQGKELDSDQPHKAHQPLSLHSNLLPPSLLGDSLDSVVPRLRTVTDDTSPSCDESFERHSAERHSSTVLPPPHRSWNIAINDHKALPKVPSHYPPFDPNCTALVTDAPPSIVVVRVSECLRRRSIAVEYDDESVTASCMTVDRVHFVINLYRTSAPSRDHDEAMEDATMAPPHDAVIVEVRKVTGGSSMSFYSACSKILLAAKGLDTGNDERPAHRRNGMEFKPRSIAKRQHPSSFLTSSRALKRRKPTLSNDNPSFDRTSIAEQSLEAALDLLRKDRLECQRLGMERLVNLTNKDSVGEEICRYISRRLLEQLSNNNASEEGIESSTNRWNLFDCLIHPGADQALEFATGTESEQKGSGVDTKNTPSSQKTKNNRMVRCFLESPSLTAVTPTSKNQTSNEKNHFFPSSLTRVPSFLKKRSLRKIELGDLESPNHSNDSMSQEELIHEARLRSIALRVFCNALETLSETKELPELLYRTSHKAQPSNGQPSHWVKPAFLLSLVQDLRGAGRPQSVSETSYKLASVHEAALAARCLRFLAGYDSDDIESETESIEHTYEASCGNEREALRDFLRSEAVLERLEYARSCGRSTHATLHYEADLTYNKLTEDDRSC